jgi:dihydroorotate dehydrogenase electron transfer subunit
MIDQSFEILFNREIKSGIFIMGFSSPLMAFESKPGQFIMVRVSEGIDPLLRRPFSICGTSDKDIICIIYKTVGHGTGILSEKKAGDILSVLGPLGQGFSLPGENKKAILVAGGIGVAPLYFLAGALKDNPVEFMAGFGSSRDIIPHEQVTGQPISVSIATDDGSEGYSGMVTGLLEEYLDGSIHARDPATIYACGPLAMLKKVSSIASHRNIPCQVSLETLMACGLGACQGCAVNILSQDNKPSYSHVCKDGPVFPSYAIDWGRI